MPAYLHPGVYVEEVPSPAKSIEGAATSTAVFVGETERGPLTPTKIVGREDFTRIYGGYVRKEGANTHPVTLAYALDGFYGNGGVTAYVQRVVDNAQTAVGNRAVGAGNNVIRVDARSPGAWSLDLKVAVANSSDGDVNRFRLVVVYRAPGAAADQIVESWDRLSSTAGDESYVVDVLRRSSFVSVDAAQVAGRPPNDANQAQPTDAQLIAASVALAGGAGGNAVAVQADYTTALGRLDEVTDAAMLVVPAPIDGSNGLAGDVANAALAYAVARKQQDLFCVADLPRNANLATAQDAVTAALGQYANYTKTDYGAVYFPWVEVSDPNGVGLDPIQMVPPSGHVAGLYARTDGRRGIWKAPAGLEATLGGVRRLEYRLLDEHQDELNPRGVNALRNRPAGGNVIWGARTLRPNSEWRYINVRRTAMFLRKSIHDGIQWAVFEGNDEPLWAALRLVVGGFMEQQYRQGAFAGSTTKEAYFVKCDAETTPEPDRVAGIVNLWVGFAPLRPAEFVIVRLSQIVNQK